MINNLPVETVTNFTDLAVIVSDRHIINIVKKANSRMGLVKRTIGHDVNMEVKRLCYQGLIRPLLEKNTVIWNANVNKKNLLMVKSI